MMISWKELFLQGRLRFCKKYLGLEILIITILMISLSPSPATAVGPFEITSADSSFTLRMQFAGQLQTAWESKDKGYGKDRDESQQKEVIAEDRSEAAPVLGRQ